MDEAIKKRIDELQAQEIDASEEYKKLQTQLDDLLMERQAVIGWAKKKIITEADLKTQMFGLTIEENEIIKQMEDLKPLLGNRADGLRELAEIFRQNWQTGYEGVVATNSPEKQFEYRKRLVRAIVSRVDVLEDKTPVVHFVIPFPEENHSIEEGNTGENVCIALQSTIQ